MSEVKRVTDPTQGPPDGVEADVQCVVTVFDRTREKGKNKIKMSIKSLAVSPCHVTCAYSNGVIGFSLRDCDMMFSVRIDELYGILREAAEAARELN